MPAQKYEAAQKMDFKTESVKIALMPLCPYALYSVSLLWHFWQICMANIF